MKCATCIFEHCKMPDGHLDCSIESGAWTESGDCPIDPARRARLEAQLGLGPGVLEAMERVCTTAKCHMRKDHPVSFEEMLKRIKALGQALDALLATGWQPREE